MVTISESTRRLLGNLFELADLGAPGLVAAPRYPGASPQSHKRRKPRSVGAIEDGRARRFGSNTCSLPRSGQAGRPRSQDMSGGRVRTGADLGVECLPATSSRMGGKDQRGGWN
jgi:hypothetical protein